MNAWIFVISAVFSPVLEPLGFDASVSETPSSVAPASVAPASVDMDQMRYRGIERLLAELETPGA